MFVQTLFSFFMHFVKRFIYEVNKLFLGKLRCKDYLSLQNYSRFSSEADNWIKENVFSIDHYILQDKDSKILLKLGFLNINGTTKFNGRVEGLKNIKETRHDCYYEGSDICTMAEFKASELSIHYDGIVKLSSISQAFLTSTVLKNVKILWKFKIHPLEHITIYLDDVRIDELNIKVSVSGLNVISWVINVITNYILKAMSFMILCFVEFNVKYYLNKHLSEFYSSQDNALEKVCKSIAKCTSAKIKCCRDEIEFAHEMSYNSKFGPTSYFYNLTRGLFEFHKTFNKVVITLICNRNVEEVRCNTLHSDTFEFESDPSSAEANESQSDTNSLISGEFESVFDYSGLRLENRTNSSESTSSETEVDSHSTENDYNNETVSTFSETSSESEISYVNDSCDVNNSHLEENYNETESHSENDSCKDINIQFEESCNESESQLKNVSSVESSSLLEESYTDGESQPKSESYEEIRYQSERNYNEQTIIQPESNSNDDDAQPEISCNNDTHTEINWKPEPTNSFYAEDDTNTKNIIGDDVTPPKSNIIGEDVTQPENNSNDYGSQPLISSNNDTHSENKCKSEADTQPTNNFNAEDDTEPENINGDDVNPHKSYNGDDVTPRECNINHEDVIHNSSCEDVAESENNFNKKVLEFKKLNLK